MTENEIFERIAETLGIGRDQLTVESSAADFPEDWDSMGTMAIVSMLDLELDIQVDTKDTDKLTSVAGILSLARQAGRLP